VEQIEQLEIRIEELREAIERSRRLMLAGQASAVVGPAMFVCFMLGLTDFTPVRMIVGIAFAIGGVLHDDPSGSISWYCRREQRRQRS
jgi:hypothetical protein